MTWSYSHRIDVRESRNSGVYVSLLIWPAFEDQVVDTMKDLGFKPVVEHETIGTIDSADLPEDMLLDYVTVEY